MLIVERGVGVAARRSCETQTSVAMPRARRQDHADRKLPRR